LNNTIKEDNNEAVLEPLYLTKIIIEDAVKFHYMEYTSWEFYLMSQTGKDSVSSKIGVRRGMLQRRLQLEEWRKKNGLRKQEYLHSLIKGSADTDSFMLVPIDLILKSLEIMLKDSVDNSERETVQLTIDEVQTDIDNGSEYYLLDGQNRLFEALAYFFNNEITLGREKLIAYDTTNENGMPEKISLSGKLYKDLPKNIQEFLRDMKVKVHMASKGDIKSFMKSLIAKNSGVGWNDWQRMVTENSFTQFRKQLENVVVGEDSLVSDKIFSKIPDAQYQFSKDGYELFVSELLIWCARQEQPKKGNTLLQRMFFKGEDGNNISDKIVTSVRKYLREFAQCKNLNKTVDTTLLRNYVMFRLAMDNTSKFDKVNLPKWKITKSVEFVAQFILTHRALYKVEEAYTLHFDDNGKQVKKDKNPNYLPFCNSKYTKDLLIQRLQILSEGLIKQEDKFVKSNIITVLDKTTMKDLLDIALDNDMKDYKDRMINATELVSGSKSYDRGHVVTKSSGGSNRDIKIQPTGSNLDYGATDL